jgi:hypothetical protein
MPLISLAILASATATAQASPVAGIAGILSGTPWWVYALLSVLIYSGIQATKPRSWPPARIAVVPVAFTLWGVASLLLTPNLGAGLIATWIATACVGAGLAAITWRSDQVGIDRAVGRIRLPASWVPLARNLAIFAAKYAIGIASALNPEARSHLAFWDIAVSGLSAGYFLGWLVRLGVMYFARLPSTPLNASGSESISTDSRHGRATMISRSIGSGADQQERIARMFRNEVSLFGRGLL